MMTTMSGTLSMRPESASSPLPSGSFTSRKSRSGLSVSTRRVPSPSDMEELPACPICSAMRSSVRQVISSSSMM
nr:hypothetical protein [Salidesulfovibrio brasiliensis]